MKINREDQNTFIMIFAILVVCVIALVAIINTLWQIVREPFNRVVAEIIKTIAGPPVYDYNFSIPTIPTANPTIAPTTTVPTPTATVTVEPTLTPTPDITQTPVPTLRNLYYNFAVSLTGNISTDLSLIGQTDNIESDATKIYRSINFAPATSNLRIKIPKINVDTPVLTGLGNLQQGMVMYPQEVIDLNNELILFCYRTYFGPTDPRSCWHIDKLGLEDKLEIISETGVFVYTVKGRGIFDKDDPTLYKTTDGNKYVRIVVQASKSEPDKRLTVLAVRDEEDN